MKALKRKCISLFIILVIAGAIYIFGVGHPAVTAVQLAFNFSQL